LNGEKLLASLHTLNLFAHIFAGCACVLLAPALLFFEKGSERHFRLGEWYFRFAWVIALTLLLPVVGLELLPEVRNFYTAGEGGSEHAFFLRFSESFAVGHLVTLFNARQAADRLRKKNFSTGAWSWILSLFGAGFCFWNAYRVSSYFNYGVVSAAYGLLLLLTAFSTRGFARRSKELSWRFAHGINAVTNIAIVYRNFIGGGPLERLLFISGLAASTQLTIIVATSYATLLATLGLQVLIIVKTRARLRFQRNVT
jgi:hypothetical protein